MPKVATILAKRNADLAMEIGNYHFNGGAYDLEVAERAYRKALRIDPAIQWGNYQLARVYFVRGEYDQALDAINRELEAWPENFRALYVRGLISGYRGDLVQTERDFSRFIQYVPREWAGYNDLAWALAKQGKHEEAKRAVESALREIEDAAENPWLWNSLGGARLNLGEYPEAEQAFRQARDAASSLTISAWAATYPGNDPAQGRDGIAVFTSAINRNLRKAIELQYR